mmetsp:Transcript_44081/g.104309  ORF Transcript_44081/g.104309 Transcript_44081/m.104309 type:complete len:537 (-) Transcript_44081:60-1670(-)
MMLLEGEEPTFADLEFCPEDSPSLLFTKYTYLLSRVKNEVAQRETSQQQLQGMEQQLQDERHARRMDCGAWEEDRRRLLDEVSVLRQRLHAKVPDDLTALRREMQELQVKYQDTSAELAESRAHGQRWRRMASNLESEAEEARRACDAAEDKARRVQDAMRGALREASKAKSREQVAATHASRGDRELQSREARLHAVRQQNKREAKRASGLEQRLATAEQAEAWAGRLARENQSLLQDLEKAQEGSITAQRGLEEASAARREALSYAGDLQEEVKALESFRKASVQQAAQLESTLADAQARVGELEAMRTSAGAQLEGLRSELSACRAECCDLRQQRSEVNFELAECTRQNFDRPFKLQEAHRKLRTAEEALEKTQADLKAERRAKDRMCAEAARNQERLRASNASCSRLRDRVRTLEEMQLRYPSQTCAQAAACSSQRRHSMHARVTDDEVGPPRRSPTPQSLDGSRHPSATPPKQRSSSAAPSMQARMGATTPTAAGTSPRQQRRSPAPVAHADDVKALRDYIAREDRRQSMF